MSEQLELGRYGRIFAGDLNAQRLRDKIQDKAGNTTTIEEKTTMAKRFGKKERKLLRVLRRQPKARKAAFKRIVNEAAAEMGITPAQMARMHKDGDEEVRATLQSVASVKGSGIEEFGEPGERDWSGFFAALMSCFEQALPIILAI